MYHVGNLYFSRVIYFSEQPPWRHCTKFAIYARTLENFRDFNVPFLFDLDIATGATFMVVRESVEIRQNGKILMKKVRQLFKLADPALYCREREWPGHDYFESRYTRLLRSRNCLSPVSEPEVAV